MTVVRAPGFTLLELMVTLVIGALLLTLLVPIGTRGHGHAELDRGARDIVAALRLTRSRAILANRPTSLFVDVANAYYRPAGEARSVALPRGMRIGLVTTEDDTLSASTGMIRFYPDGSSSGGGVSLTLGDGRYDVLVDWLTGEVTLRDHAQMSQR